MQVNIFPFVGLIVSSVLILCLFLFLRKQTKQTTLKRAFSCILACLLICCIGLIAQITLSDALNIEPIYFDYFVYIGTCFLPVTFLIMSLIFVKPDQSINIKLLSICLSIVPIICLISLWTNDFHHLFYIKYSTILSQGEYGPFFYITSIYTYSLFAIGLIYLAIYSIKNIRFYFYQSLLIFLGALVPIVVNVLGLLGIFDLSIYITPICFSITILCFALSIFKFGFLKIKPIAIQRIVNRISDSYIVLDSDLTIVDFNETFLKTFHLTSSSIINKKIFDVITLSSNKDIKEIENEIISAIQKTKYNSSTIVLDKYFKNIDRYFHIEINSISQGKTYLGTLLLLKDVTQHKRDLETIEKNQEILIERERLATLGQMIGGIAHNLKTPIMSISGATEGILDLVNEYKNSISDPEVTIQDHLEIAGDMEEWIHKIQSHLSYMSDVITTVKGQAVAFSDNTTFTSFTIDDFVRQVNILMKHELSKALIELEEKLEVPEDTVVKGNINSLVQVVNNIISNAIQAYDGKPGEKIILDIYKEKDNLIFKIQDFAGGLSSTVKSKLFKEMVTTKGKNGTGLGLFMSYSNIRAHFNGDIRFDSRKGKGTTFYIEIPYGGRRTKVGSWKIGIRK